MSWMSKKTLYFLVPAVAFILYNNFVWPDFPQRNIDTRTIKKNTSGKFVTSTPHMPINQYSLDARIGLSLFGKGVFRFYVVKPENVVRHFRDAANAKDGANMLGYPTVYTDFFNHIKRSYISDSSQEVVTLANGLQKAVTIKYEPSFEGFFCEKTEQITSPTACGLDDCYTLTFVSALESEKPHASLNRDDFVKRNGAQMNDFWKFYPERMRFVSVDLEIRVSNPKTPQASIVSITPKAGTAKQGPVLKYRFGAEHNVVGDQRLLVFRLGGASINGLNTRGVHAGGKTNIVYSTYDNKKSQCDVTQWTEFFPISYAHYDAFNGMKNRYKFARYPFRTSLGDVFMPKAVNGGVVSPDLGGSYPWMDEDAANLFFTVASQDLAADGKTNTSDTFYTYDYSSGQFRSFYQEPVGHYVTPNTLTAEQVSRQLSFLGLSPTTTQNLVEINNIKRDIFEKIDNATTIAMAGFWTRGKTVTLDGLLNNTNHSFEVSNQFVWDMTRRLNIYGAGKPPSQVFEPTGMTRELGDDAEWGLYSRNPYLRSNGIDAFSTVMSHNANYINSFTNRFNYLQKLMPGNPRDVVWHLGNTRYSEELVFDDFISPFVFINAEMNHVVSNFPDNSWNSGWRVTSFDGIENSQRVVKSLTGFPSLKTNKHALAFQNSATPDNSFMVVPSYGRPIGNMRVEPIAKGGIFGKGAWLNGAAAIEFQVPVQSYSRFANKSWYVGAFLDSRVYNNNRIYSNTLFYLRNFNGYYKSVRLAKKWPSDVVEYTHIQLMINERVISELPLHGNLRIYKNGYSHGGWKHIAIQFNPSNQPLLVLDGMVAGAFSPNPLAKATVAELNGFFNPYSNSVIGIGAPAGGVRGWVDDFKVIALDIENTEERCHHARGTIVKLNSDAASYYRWKASAYPVSTHQEVASQSQQSSSSQFLCYVEYGNRTDYQNNLQEREVSSNLRALPAGVESMRERILMENKFLVYNQPRPDQSSNKFCLSCHVQSGVGVELGLEALTARSNVLMQNDARRLPSQAPATMSGVIPANYFGNRKPASTLSHGSAKHNIDQWLHGP